LSTFFLLIAVAIILLFGELVALNGASESQGFNAMSITVICQSVSMFPAVILARWVTKFLITKYNWNAFLTIVIAVIAGTSVGSILSFISVIIAIPLAGIR
jgi:hypothetical protein